MNNIKSLRKSYLNPDQLLLGLDESQPTAVPTETVAEAVIPPATDEHPLDAVFADGETLRVLMFDRNNRILEEADEVTLKAARTAANRMARTAENNIMFYSTAERVEVRRQNGGSLFETYIVKDEVDETAFQAEYADRW